MRCLAVQHLASTCMPKHLLYPECMTRQGVRSPCLSECCVMMQVEPASTDAVSTSSQTKTGPQSGSPQQEILGWDTNLLQV